MSRNAFFSSRSEEKRFFDVVIVVKNKSKCGLSWSVLLPTTSTCHYSFPKHLFELFLLINEVCKSFWKESYAYKQLSCIMQRVHFQVRVGVFSCEEQYSFRYLWYCGKKQIECGLAWFVLLSTTIRVITVCNKLSYITKRALCFLVIDYISSIHPWANSRCRISQSERALCFSYVIKANSDQIVIWTIAGHNTIHMNLSFTRSWKRKDVEIVGAEV